jgi:hypothetical protein
MIIKIVLAYFCISGIAIALWILNHSDGDGQHHSG